MSASRYETNDLVLHEEGEYSLTLHATHLGGIQINFYFFTFYCALQPHRQLMRNCLLKITVFLKKLIAIEFGGFNVLLNCAYSSNCLGHIGLKVHCLHFINGFG